MRTAEPWLRELIDAVAAAHLPHWGEFSPGEWLEGLVLTESSGDINAVRYEPRYNDHSYGLCQIMGLNIRSLLGLKGVTHPIDLSFAYAPAVNLYLACLLLGENLDATHSSVPRALARYNGGPTGSDGTPMRLQSYVDKVETNTKLVKADRQQKGWG